MEIPGTATALTCDVAVVGGGTAGTMAAITAAEHGASVLLLEKAHVRHSGALAMGMDGVNNAVIPGRATPEEYVAEITRANDGVVNQETVWQTATRGYEMVRRLERYGVKFAKDLRGEYDVRRVHRSGSYVLPMPEGKDVKKVLYRVLRQRSIRDRVRIENRVMPVRVLTGPGGRACGLAGFNTRTGEFVTVAAGAVILATGACGRLGLPASGYLYGTYENPTNAGDGHAMAYHAGAELSGLECFQINPLIKDYNGPACAYVANPFGGYQVNHNGERFVDCDYWSGQMMAEVAREISSARGPIYLKLTHLPSPVLSELESILHTTERPTRGTFHTGRRHDYRTHDVEMHISEIGLCGGHSSSGVWVDANARTTVPGLYAAGDLACVPHNYMIGAFVFGDLAGADAVSSLGGGSSYGSSYAPGPAEELPQDQIAAAHELIYRPLRNPDGPPQAQVEYKLRRFVNDYVAPPKTEAKLLIALETFKRMEQEIAAMGARSPHELMRCAEVTFIRDCAELATRASLVRAESRWGLYHQRADQPARDDDTWFWHLNVRRSAGSGVPEFVKRAVAPYLVPVPGFAVPDRTPSTEVVLGDPIGAAGPALTARGTAADLARDQLATAPGGGLGAPTRLPELLRLAETNPSLADLRPFLEDPDPRVRRAAVGVLAESAPAGAGAALASAALDPHGTVRQAAAAALRELAMVLPPSDAALLDGLRQAVGGSDPIVRCAALDALREMGVGDHAMFSAALDDADHRVRLSAVRGLARLGAVPALSRAAEDPSQQVRIGVAEALAAIGDPRAGTVVRQLVADLDPHVRAAAFTAAATIGCPPPLDEDALAALRDPAWQVRAGAAQALGAAYTGAAYTGAGHPTLTAALAAAAADPHPDVRKAAVIALRSCPDALDTLRAAMNDSDADVRAHARHAVAHQRV